MIHTQRKDYRPTSSNGLARGNGYSKCYIAQRMDDISPMKPADAGRNPQKELELSLSVVITLFILQATMKLVAFLSKITQIWR